MKQLHQPKVFMHKILNPHRHCRLLRTPVKHPLESTHHTEGKETLSRDINIFLI